MSSTRARVRIKRSSSDGSSSGIDVAAARPTENHNTSSDIHVAEPSVNGVTDDGVGASCRVVDGHMLVIRLRPDQVALLNIEPKTLNGLDGHIAGNDDNDHVGGGRNHRGTFSKKHVQRHPEIEWVHRGQGRYLPAEQVRRESTAAAAGAPERKSRSRRTIQEEFDHQVQIKREELNESDTLQPPITGTTKSLRSTSADVAISPPVITAPAPRKRAPRDSLTDALSGPPQYGLRRHHRDSLSQSQPGSPAIATASESRSGRFARRSDAKFLPSIEKGLSLTLPHRRTSLRKSFTAATTAESDEDESEVEVEEDSEVGNEGSEMSRGRKDTYDREYVDAHPGEVFHHAGNGWFRRGPRPSGKTKGKGKAVKREVVAADEVAVPVVKQKKKEKKRQVSYGLDSNASIHKEDLGNYPGQVFTHKGNGWYRPGPDPSGQRRSIVIASGGDDSENEAEEEEEESAEEDEEEGSDDDDGAPAGTVGRKYKDAHPEVEWVHRGNGRYVRKSKLSAPPLSAEPLPGPAETMKRGSERTYSKKFVIDHPSEEFYHTGNARYKRGSRPSVVKSAPPESVVEDDDHEESEDGDGGGLVDKAFVTAHPHLQFHHRGQGRYARGPRPATTPARNEGSEDEDDGEGDVDGVSRESLVDGAFVNAHPHITFYHRGQGRWAFGMPPSYSHNKVAVRGPGAREWKVSGEEDGDEGPAKTALFMKAEGPEKFPEYLWHYRGGGKWGRMTKMEVDLAASVGAGKGRRGQRRGVGDDGGEERPKMRRSRKGLHGGVGEEGDGPKPRVQAPKVKPRMLEPEEDVLEDDDLPSIFGEEWPALTGTEDAIDKQTRKVFKPLNTNKILASLTKFDPAARSTGNLLEIAANAQRALQALQEEYLSLDRVTAQHAKIPRRPAKGGTVPVDAQVFEDRKEADLYDYAFDPRRIGFQDPEAQHIVRDAEGRELRQRRNRTGVGATDTVPGWKFGEEGLDGKRQSRQPNRFDANIEMQQPARKRMRAMGGASPLSMTPDRAATPLGGALGNNTQFLGLGRIGNVPKRIQQLRGESVGSVRSEGGSPAKHKGRPPGSKNLHKRSDAGVPKGPRKKKVVEVGEGSEVKGGEAEVERDYEM
ncbi:hypothetical protein LTR56_008530 [Elasticomyces elasticus]|nr:hypothetical protein LTR56_008530 [Elasticomyces elasticus]KAK3668925.1 hypothetical protein LTR22_000003 [Elasticomyces elasticus]KAK4914738.1 hypothetical protein LTR49_017080 [Elasticomyces elasticus]KAK5759233.1 hypothetical protein LTS12_010702 [Elasticomyces elasticus]